MKNTGVSAHVAIERMWIYARALSVSEKETLSHSIMSGSEVTYAAYDRDDSPIGSTRVTPEQFPVYTVTETTF